MSLPNLADTVLRFATGEYAVTRRPKNTYVAGREVVATPEPITLRASVQPATGKQLQRLPEGMRTRDTIAIFTPTELFIQSETHLPDLIAYREGSYEVQALFRFDELGAYFEALAVRV